MKNRITMFYSWLSEIAASKWGMFFLFLFSFADASFLPLPVTTLFVILILLNTRKTYKYILYVILGTAAGAVAGYALGHFAWLKPDGGFTGIVQFAFNNLPGFSEEFYQKIHELFAKWDFWILCGATLTPLPYGMFSVASGVFNINIILFLIITLISQGIKFSLLAIITLKLGSKGWKILQLNWKPIAIISSICILIIIVLNNVL